MSGPGLEMGQAAPAHLPALAQIAAHAHDPWDKNALEACLDSPLCRCFAAFSGNAPVAFACFSLMDGGCCLQMLATHPDKRRMGIARRLLEYSLESLARLGAGRCFLEVRASNHGAIALYRALGFGLLARRPGLYSFPKEDGLAMEKIL